MREEDDEEMIRRREEDEEEMVRRLQETISEIERLKAALNETANRSQVCVCVCVRVRASGCVFKCL